MARSSPSTIKRGQALSLASLISKVDATGKREMEAFLAGGINASDFLPYLRLSVKRLLNENSATRLKPTERHELMMFAAEFGLRVDTAEPRSIKLDVRLTRAEWERLALTAGAGGVTRSKYVQDAIAEKQARGGRGVISC